jgi:hypothetical protein
MPALRLSSGPQATRLSNTTQQKGAVSSGASGELSARHARWNLSSPSVLDRGRPLSLDLSRGLDGPFSSRWLQPTDPADADLLPDPSILLDK